MAGPAWLIDSRRIASKIKNASETVGSSRSRWMSNPTKACPRCKHIIDNSDVLQEWPGLPRGVKFDPSDQELLWHLLTKVGKGDGKSHPFIDEFIPTVDEDDGICYTHPQKLPGVKQDGSVSHFFHRTFKAYNTGTRKRRKIHSDDLRDVRWHKTGKTKPVIIDGKHLGCKKIMVLYLSPVKGGKPEKTNWVMHQYHLGTGEDEHDGEFVASKVFYQQQSKPSDKGLNQETLDIITPQADLIPGSSDLVIAEHHLRSPIRTLEVVTPQVDPIASSDLLAAEHHLCSPTQTSDQINLYYGSRDEDTDAQPELEKLSDHDTRDKSNTDNRGIEKLCNKDNEPTEDTKWWEGESQFLLDSQQLAEGIGICDEFLQSQSQSSYADDEEKMSKPCLSEYARLPVEDLKKDLEECRSIETLDHANIELDTPPDFRLSQLEFGSQDSFMAWAGSKLAD